MLNGRFDGRRSLTGLRPAAAWLASFVIHLLVTLAATRSGPPRPDRPLQVRDLRRASQRNERLVFVTPDAKEARVSPFPAKAKWRARSVPKPAILDDTPGTQSDPTMVVGDSVVRRPLSETEDSSSAGSFRRDSIPTSARGYERPIHPALIGLVPRWGGGASGSLWGPSVTALAASLAERPPDCTEKMVGFFMCKRRLRMWREDSVFHVNVRCRRDASDYRRRMPADCDRFLRDSLSSLFAPRD